MKAGNNFDDQHTLDRRGFLRAAAVTIPAANCDLVLDDIFAGGAIAKAVADVHAFD